MNKLQQLKNKIQEAVPEIMGLKFGCEVEYRDTRTLGDGGKAKYIEGYPSNTWPDDYNVAQIYINKGGGCTNKNSF